LWGCVTGGGVLGAGFGCMVRVRWFFMHQSVVFAIGVWTVCWTRAEMVEGWCGEVAANCRGWGHGVGGVWGLGRG